MEFACPCNLGARGTILGGKLLVGELGVRRCFAPALDMPARAHRRKSSMANTMIRVMTTTASGITGANAVDKRASVFQDGKGNCQPELARERNQIHRPSPFPPLWRLRGAPFVASRGFCSWDLSHSRHTPTIASMAGASCAGLPVHSRHASVFASRESAPRHALSTLFAKISQQVFDFFEFVLVQARTEFELLNPETRGRPLAKA